MANRSWRTAAFAACFAAAALTGGGIAARRVIDGRDRAIELAGAEVAGLEDEVVREFVRTRRLSEILRHPCSDSAADAGSIDARIAAWAPGPGLAAINQGAAHGVRPEMRFTIFRGDRFVGSGVVLQAARDWATIRIDTAAFEPEAGDEASNRVPLASIGPPVGR
jgi:hypothetical protein